MAADPDTAPKSEDEARPAVRLIGRYALLGKLASGGMATVHVGRLLGPVGFTRMVAIKRLHPEYARDPEFVSMFLDEARLAAKISHPNVVSTLDVVATGGELFLVMEYLQGQSLSWLIRHAVKSGDPIPPRVVAGIISGCLQGLHAAHEARDERGMPLNIVHRDVSPQNVMVGADGLARVLDFGVAKAAGRMQNTREGHIKGKLAYMSPEQLQTDFIDRTADVYAAAVVLWESLTLKRLFRAETQTATLAKILSGTVTPPSQVAPWVPKVFDAVVMRGLERDLTRRFATAREMALALERCGHIASTAEVGEWLERVAKTELDEHAARIAAIELAAGLNKTHGMESLTRALSQPTEIDEESSSSEVLRQAKKVTPDTLPTAIVPAPPPSSPTPHSSPASDSRLPTIPDLGGEEHVGESASQLSSVSLALGRRSGAPESTVRPRSMLPATTLVFAAAALLGAGLWLTTSRQAPSLTPAVAGPSTPTSLAAPGPASASATASPETSATEATSATPAATASPLDKAKSGTPAAPAATTSPLDKDKDDAESSDEAGVVELEAPNAPAQGAAPHAPWKKPRPKPRGEKPRSPFDSLGGRE